MGIISGILVLYYGVLDRLLDISWYLQREAHLNFIVILAFLILILSGVITAWFREAAGGMMVLLGYILSLVFREIEGSLYYIRPFILIMLVVFEEISFTGIKQKCFLVGDKIEPIANRDIFTLKGAIHVSIG
jgi:hypothetical protein